MSFALEETETLGLVGESGSGKTTLALSILRLLPTAARNAGGEMLFDGEDLLKKSPDEMRPKLSNVDHRRGHAYS